MSVLGELAHPLHPELRELLNRLVMLEQGRQSLIDHLWATIPSVVNERLYENQGQAVLTINATTSELWTVESIITSIPAGQTGLLQLGDSSMPVPAGTFTMAPVSVLLRQVDPRVLTSTGAGAMGLWLMGTLRPTRGTMHGN